MSTSSSRRSDGNDRTPVKKLRLACDACHHAKTKCCGGSPCAGCLRTGHRCVYSQSNRVGRPKGTKNKRKASLSTIFTPPQAEQDSGKRRAKRTKSLSSDYDINRTYNNEATLVLPFMNIEDMTPMMHSQYLNNPWSEPQTTQSMAPSFGTDNYLSNWPDTFQMPTTGNLDYPFSTLATTTSNDSSAFGFASDTGQEELPYDLASSLSDVGMVTGLNPFPPCISPSSYVPALGSGMGTSEDLFNHNSPSTRIWNGHFRRSFQSQQSQQLHQHEQHPR